MGIQIQNAAAHLIIADQPHGNHVVNIEGFGDATKPPPLWNRFLLGWKSKDWYNQLFMFANTYLDDDGRLLVFMPNGLTYELLKNAVRLRYCIKGEWICHQPQPLVHAIFEDMMVRVNQCTVVLH